MYLNFVVVKKRVHFFFHASVLLLIMTFDYTTTSNISSLSYLSLQFMCSLCAGLKSKPPSDGAAATSGEDGIAI